MPRRALKPVNSDKNYLNCPWTNDFCCERPYDKFLEYQSSHNIPEDKIANHLTFDLKLDRQKAELIEDIYKFQDKLVRNDQEVNLVVSLPFCLSRCFNCTRVMYEKNKNTDVYPYYLDCLKKELASARKIIQKKCYLVQNILYTGNLLALECDEMESLLRNTAFPFANVSVEIGSPAFVTDEKLKILKKYNVKRLIFNALTFNTVSLRQLCRRFEFKDIYDVYSKVLGFGFETCFELVVGLLDEKELQLKRTLSMAVDLGTNGINLYARNCKYIKSELPIKNDEEMIAFRKTLAFTHSFLKGKGYMPYFIFNTEVDSGCFENVGYSIKGYQSKLMIDLAGGISTTIGCGTNANSLLVNNLKKTKYSFKNPYDASQYVFGVDDLISKKEKFFNINPLQ